MSLQQNINYNIDSFWKQQAVEHLFFKDTFKKSIFFKEFPSLSTNLHVFVATQQNDLEELYLYNLMFAFLFFVF